MSYNLPSRPESPINIGAITIVASRYNARYVDALVENATDELARIASDAEVVVHRVPGAYEVPLAVQKVAESSNPDAIIAFGVIIEGETAHADFIGRCVTEALMRVSLERRVPVIHEVLLVKNEQQAARRCLEAELNRGIEAARTAVAMAGALRRINTH
jgi:6,7-dimethyl-8-ribityllumazine synthase